MINSYKSGLNVGVVVQNHKFLTKFGCRPKLGLRHNNECNESVFNRFHYCCRSAVIYILLAKIIGFLEVVT